MRSGSLPRTEMSSVQPVPIPLEEGAVSGLLLQPPSARALLALGPGAGAGMQHRFLTGVATRLAARRVATLRFQFPYMERGARRPDPAPVLLATVRVALAAAEERANGLPLFAGGKSMGGRMTSLALAERPHPGIRGLVFFGFPLHAPGRRDASRAAHLAALGLPMLFLQGTRDHLADRALIGALVADLGPAASLHLIEGADHGFHMLKRSGRSDEEVLDELADRASSWMLPILATG